MNVHVVTALKLDYKNDYTLLTLVFFSRSEAEAIKKELERTFPIVVLEERSVIETWPEHKKGD